MKRHDTHGSHATENECEKIKNKEDNPCENKKNAENKKTMN